MKLFPPPRTARMYLVYVGAFLLVLGVMVLIFLLIGGRMTGNG